MPVMNFLLLVAGGVLVFGGLFFAVKGRQRLFSLLGGLSLADLGYLIIALGLGGAGGFLAAALLACYNGCARGGAFACLYQLQRRSENGSGSLEGIAKAHPLLAVLFSVAMFAGMGISFFFTPEAKPFLLSLALQSSSFLLPSLMVAANVVGVVLTLKGVHTLWGNSSYVYLRDNSGWLTDWHKGAKLPACFIVLIALMGLFNHEFVMLLSGGSEEIHPFFNNFFVSWHSSTTLLYGGAVAVFALGFVNTQARNILAVALSALAFVLICMDSSLAPLSRYFGVMVCGVGTVVALYSWGYMQGRTFNSAYYALLLIMFGSLNGIALAENFGGFFVFWELMTLSSYILVAWDNTDSAHAAARKYFIMCSVAAAVMLPGLLLFWSETGILDIAMLSQGARDFLSFPAIGSIVVLLVFVGCGVKAGLFPGHSWLPDAHPAAPSSISAPLSGVLTKSGVFGIIQVLLVVFGVRILGVDGLGATGQLAEGLVASGLGGAIEGAIEGTIAGAVNQGEALGTVLGAASDTGKALAQGALSDYRVPFEGWILCGLGLATMLYGEFMALRQRDIKRLLAYSTMGQIGEICMTLGLMTWLAAAGALMHVFNHAIMKDLLFLCCGALILRSGSRSLSDLSGLGKAMPFTATCMVIGLLSILGLPPFSGFMSKFMMLYALADISPFLAGLMLLASMAGCVYYTRIIKTLIFEPYKGPAVEEAPLSMRVSMGLLAGSCVFLGLFPSVLVNLVTPIFASLQDVGAFRDPVMAQFAIPLPRLHWPVHSIILLLGALVPVFLRHDARKAGQAAAGLLALAALVILFQINSLSTLSFGFALFVALIGCVNMVYSMGYMDHSHTQWRFYSFFLCMTAGLTGVATSADIFNFFMFWEIMSSWSLYFVIVHEENEVALREGFKYFFFNVLGAAFIFLGVVLVINWSGGAGFETIAKALPAMSGGQIGSFFALMSVGFVMKAAQLPFRIDIQMHPASAPTPVSGYISSVLLKSSLFGLVKLFLGLGGGVLALEASRHLLPFTMDMVVWIGGITIVMAGAYAVFQDDIKLVLIYSTVSQLGYMVVGIALGTSLGVAGGLLHVVNHIFFKDLLFLVAGAVIFATSRQSMSGMGGLGARMPITLGLFCIGAVCVIGLPPSSGFTSKWILYHALMEEGYVLVAILSLVGSVLTLAYMTKMLHSVFLGQPAKGLQRVQEVPRIMLLPMGIMAAGCVITSFFPGVALIPINGIVTSFNLPPLDVALWGIRSGASAWNATLATVMMATVWWASSWFIKRFTVKQRVTDIHVCGIPPAELQSGTMPKDIYSAPVSLFQRWRAKHARKEG